MLIFSICIVLIAVLAFNLFTACVNILSSSVLLAFLPVRYVYCTHLNNFFETIIFKVQNYRENKWTEVDNPVGQTPRNILRNIYLKKSNFSNSIFVTLPWVFKSIWECKCLFVRMLMENSWKYLCWYLFREIPR